MEALTLSKLLYMKTLLSSKSVCRRCRYYEPEGRRGGHCQQLNVAVQGDWTACVLAIPPFSPAWESFEDIMVWQQKTLVAMEASAELAMTDALSEVAMADTASVYETTALSSISTSTERSLSGASYSPEGQVVTAPPAQKLRLKALWM